jgi:hypothetical protein
MTPSWHQQPPSAIIQDALIFHGGLMVAGSAEHGEAGPSSSGSSVQRPKMDFALLLTPQASALPHPPMGGQHQHQQLQQPPPPPLPQPHPVPLPQQPAGAPSSSRPLVVQPHQQQQQVPHMLPVDVQPLTGVDQDKQLPAKRQQQQQQQQQETKRRCICVGEVKTVARLMDQSQQQPLDLIGAWRDSRHPRCAQAQQVISQVGLRPVVCITPRGQELFRSVCSVQVSVQGMSIGAYRVCTLACCKQRSMCALMSDLGAAVLFFPPATSPLTHGSCTTLPFPCLQLFTYMQHWRICFGYITCFRHTYLAYCQPKDRRTLYLWVTCSRGAGCALPLVELVG